MKKILFIFLLPVFIQAQTLLSDDFSNRIHFDGAVGAWVLIPEYHNGEVTGKTVVQDLANSHDMTLSGWANIAQMADSAYTASPYYDGGNGVSFDGVDDYLYIASGSTAPFKPGTGDFTIEVAFRLTSLANENIVSIRDASSGWWSVVVTNALHSMYSAANSPAVRETAVAISIGTDYHFITTSDRDGNLTTWRNAAIANAISAADFADDNISPTGELRIGRQGNGNNYANGVIYFVNYYDSVLPINTIKDHQKLPAGWVSLNGGGATSGFTLGVANDTIYYNVALAPGMWEISIRDSAASNISYKILTSPNKATWNDFASGTTGTAWQTKSYSGFGSGYIAVAVASGTAFFDDLVVTKTATSSRRATGGWLRW